jgi:hypothetical protein
VGGRGDPRGRATRRLDPDHPCLNCGDPTHGEFCPSCGQRKADVQVSIGTLVADALEDELLIGRRLPTTLGALLLRPGKLTADYVDGRVVRYVRPLRLYLVSSIIFFLLLSLASLRLFRDGAGRDEPSPPVPDLVIPMPLGVEIGRGEASPEEPAGGARAREGPGVTAADPAPSDRPAMEEIEAALGEVRAALEDPELTVELRDSLRARRSALVRQYTAAALRDSGRQRAAAEEEAESADGAASGADAVSPSAPEALRVHLGHPILDSLATARAREMERMGWRVAAERVLGDLIGYIPTLMFLLLPFFALVLKGLYLRQGRFYAEHFIFLLHTHAFIYVIFTVLLLAVISGWFRAWMFGAAFLWVTTYVFLAMRRVYGQRPVTTFFKMWTLGWAYFWVLLFTVPVAAVVTVLLL